MKKSTKLYLTILVSVLIGYISISLSIQYKNNQEFLKLTSKSILYIEMIEFEEKSLSIPYDGGYDQFAEEFNKIKVLNQESGVTSNRMIKVNLKNGDLIEIHTAFSDDKVEVIYISGNQKIQTLVKSVFFAQMLKDI